MKRLELIAPMLLATLLWPAGAVADDRRPVSALAGTRTEVYVTNMEGLERKGHLLTAGEDGIRLTFAGRETLVPWSDVAIVERQGDPVWDGALKGAGIAAAIYGLAVIGSDGHGEGQAQFVVQGMIAWSLIGAVADALHVARSRVFVSPEVRHDFSRHSNTGRTTTGVIVGARFFFDPELVRVDRLTALAKPVNAGGVAGRHGRRPISPPASAALFPRRGETRTACQRCRPSW